MLLIALSFLAGISFVQQWAELPGFLAVSLLSGVLSVVLALWWTVRDRPYSWLFQSCGFVLAGIIWAILHGQSYLDHRLAEELAGKDIVIEGVIVGIPRSRDKVQRFIFQVHRFGNDNARDAQKKLPEKLRLSWYYGKPVHAGERWRFQVRLKPPHGFFNPGGFDYESWLFQQNIHATGYIRKSSDNRKLESAGTFSLDAIRQKLSTHIQQILASKPHAGLLTALAVGDRSSISKSYWETLINTGTNHLMAISGLHIGLAAGFGFWLIRRLTPTRIMKRVSAQQVAIWGGLIVAFVYALLAGLSIPTQRALLMLFCFAGAALMKRNFHALDALSTALLAILVWNPVSILSPGFWFSFLAVFVIFYVFTGRLQANRRWKQWGWMQISIALGLFPVSLLLFQQTSLASPLANFVMVPYVSLLVVPLVLLSLLFLPVSEVISNVLLITANYLLETIWPYLTWLSEQQFSYWNQSVTNLTVMVLALLGVMLLLAPRGFPARWLSLCFILPIFINPAEKPIAGAFELTLLDVGQGLSAVIRTRNHLLVFDTGNRFGKRLDAGEAVVLPFLREASNNHIDRLVISHGDSDHIGGAKSILSNFSVAELIGQDIENLEHINKKPCIRGWRWYWDEVEFEFLHPDESYYKQANNRSCILKVSGAGGSLLLTGDIEKKVERKLISDREATVKADVLVVPHHGSKTSSSKRFIAKVSPEIALFSVGYRNRYRLPNNDIVKRYDESDATLYSSGHSGAISVLFDPLQGVSVVDEYRKSHHKYWNHEISFR